MQLVDLLFDDNLKNVVAELFGVEPRYQLADSDFPDTVEVPFSFPDLPENQQFIYIQIIVPILNLMRVKRGHYIEGCFNPATNDFLWAPMFECPKADGYITDFPLTSVDQFKSVLEVVKSRL